MSDIFDLFDADTDFSKSFIPNPIPVGKGRAHVRAWLLRELQRARKVGMGISTVAIHRAGTTVAPARVRELKAQGWAIVTKPECEDGSGLYYLAADEPGTETTKHMGVTFTLTNFGPDVRSHTAAVEHMSEAEHESLERYIQRACMTWIHEHKPEWKRLIP